LAEAEGGGVTLDLRPYQEQQYAEARELIRAGTRTLLIQLPTGGGKTVMVAKMLANAASKGYRGWFNVHRRELVKQSVLTLGESAGINLGIVAAGFPGDRHQAIQVCSIPTLGKRREALPRPNLIVWDECHHLAAASWGAIFAAYPDAVHVGMTATPERLDGTGLGKYFERMICGPSTGELIRQGYLSPYRLFAPNMVDLTGVHMVGGDFNKRELNDAMQRSAVVGDALGHYLKYASGMRAVVFMWSVESSIDMARRFNAAGIPAAHVDGETDAVSRDRAIDAFKRGEIKVLYERRPIR
jgi:DNA repair protein RadD